MALLAMSMGCQGPVGGGGEIPAPKLDGSVDAPPPVKWDTIPYSLQITDAQIERPAPTKPEAGVCVGSACPDVAEEIACGNGRKQLGEECDDHNTTPGDGCSGICTVEFGWYCRDEGTVCFKSAATGCGSGKLEKSEACDDGNPLDGDGCSSTCVVEVGWTCSIPGRPCVASAAPGVCGDGSVDFGEQCDDLNVAPEDGCSAVCQLEPHYVCPQPGLACTVLPFCGDGAVELSLLETCDDGNDEGGDGCSDKCLIEPNYTCPTPGQPCVSTVVCSDGIISGEETCDDGNKVAKDGCSDLCQVEDGWSCPIPKAPCGAEACGDGILAGVERCDDGNDDDGDGCSGKCTVEPGWGCGPNQWRKDLATTKCYETVCGDGQLEGLEQCDDGNTRPFDGCTPECTHEPKCGYPEDDTTKAYQCFSVCGDGIKMPDEACDDGNTQDGDGCSAKCAVEEGYVCTESAPKLGDKLILPVVYRDFTWKHPQFEVEPTADRRLPGIALPAIGDNGKPVYNPDFVGLSSTGTALERPSTMDGPAQPTTGSTLMTDANDDTFRPKAANGEASLATAEEIAAAFAEWYTDDPNATGDAAKDAANPAVSRITIEDTLELAQSDDTPGKYFYYNPKFFPVDGKGFGNITYTDTDHNFGFTSEVRYWFEYTGGEKLEFRGDDDVWVFVNGRLSVDLGGIHNELRGILTLGSDTTPSSYCVDNTKPECAGQDVCDTPAPANCTDVPDHFGMEKGKIYEIVVFQAERHITNSNYRLTISGFNAPRSTCVPVCGDGVVTFGEVCDLGTEKNTGEYGTCTKECTLAPYCGDGKPQNPPEECDDGKNLATYGGTSKVCAPSCKIAPYCGDGIVNGPEKCDEGSANGSGYGHCTDTCMPGPDCGDGTVNGPEECDNGTERNTGAYGTCTPECKIAPYCGDGVKSGPEQCDNGVANVAKATAYGPNLCTNFCEVAPYCGDGHIDEQWNEQCDGGIYCEACLITFMP